MTRILAARFPDWEHASQALESIQDEIDNGVQVEIAPLAGGGTTAADTLLAGHFAEEQKPHVETIVREAGGVIVADVDERWTRPRHGASDSPNPTRGFTY
ncbi:MAG TPA: hypothetical protein VNT28_02940 [Candidatus Limnocylindrales bacterium]|nr:hypothetical protein [Candidatus Limnocylindrales bacterium]